MHSCHATGCRTAIPPDLFMCKYHWFLLKREMRAAIWRTYRPGQCDDWNISQAYSDAAKQAIIYIAGIEGKAPNLKIYEMLEPGRTE